MVLSNKAKGKNKDKIKKKEKRQRESRGISTVARVFVAKQIMVQMDVITC